MAFVYTVSLISQRVIDGISSNLANTFLSSRQILIIKNEGLGANTVGVISLVILNGFCVDSLLNILKSH